MAPAAPDESAEPAATGILTFPLGGMFCAFCTEAVQEALERTAGVTGAEVDYLGETVRVRYDPARIDSAGLRAVLDAKGFPVRDPERFRPFETLVRERREAGHRLRQATLLALAALALLLVRESGVVPPRVLLPLLRTLLPLLALASLAGPGRADLAAGLRSLAQGRPDAVALYAGGALAGLLRRWRGGSGASPRTGLPAPSAS
jgi:Cu+-exporting ATPase